MAKSKRRRPQAVARAATVTHRSQVATFQGPIPPPATIEGYEAVCPGAADRIISMGEQEQQHRHRHEMASLKGLTAVAILGQLFGFALGICGISGGVWLLLADKRLSGFSVFLGSLGTILGLFLRTRGQSSQPQKR